MPLDVAALIEQLDPTPNPLTSESQADRYDHHDLAAETADSLRRELAWLRVRNHLIRSEWHLLREEAVADRLAAFRDRQRDTHRGQRAGP